MNNALFLENNQTVPVEGTQLLYHNHPMKQINMALNLEGYPNRDSLKYQELYGLNTCHTVRRGTLRYNNFSFVMRSLIRIGLFDQTA
jgi:hypothetical protein